MTEFNWAQFAQENPCMKPTLAVLGLVIIDGKWYDQECFGTAPDDYLFPRRAAALIRDHIVGMVLDGGGCIQTAEVPTLDGQHYAVVPYGSEGRVSYYTTLDEALAAFVKAQV